MKSEVYQDASGEWRWRIIADNGNIMATSSEGYVDRRDAEHGLETVLQMEVSDGENPL